MGSRGPEQALSSRWLALALKAFFNPRPSGTRRGATSCGSPRALRLEVADRGLDVRQGVAGDADLVLAADDETLVGPRPEPSTPTTPSRAGGVEIVAGDRAELDSFVEVFRFAERVPA